MGSRGTGERARSTASWWLLLALILGAFALAVTVLNSTIYSAGGFVTSYLGALERHDVRAALETPGVRLINSAREELLTPEALGDLADVRVVSVTDVGDLRSVRVEYTLDGVAAESTFIVEHTGLRLGFFNGWAFNESPMSGIQVLPLHDPRFRVNGVELTVGKGGSGVWQVLVPGRYVVGHESTYLEADPVPLRITRAGSLTPATVEARANDHFVTEVQREVDAFLLEECATQQVLFPTGCPFGKALSNRVISPPVWTIPSLPRVAIVPGDSPGTWVVDEAPGVAHLAVEVQSLFDGTISTLDEDVPFSLTWSVVIRSDDSVAVD